MLGTPLSLSAWASSSVKQSFKSQKKVSVKLLLPSPAPREMWEGQPLWPPLGFPGDIPKGRGKATLVTCSKTTAQSKVWSTRHRKRVFTGKHIGSPRCTHGLLSGMEAEGR